MIYILFTTNRDKGAFCVERFLQIFTIQSFFCIFETLLQSEAAKGKW